MNIKGTKCRCGGIRYTQKDDDWIPEYVCFCPRLTKSYSKGRDHQRILREKAERAVDEAWERGSI